MEFQDAQEGSVNYQLETDGLQIESFGSEDSEVGVKGN
jgi:hypothetical protein